MSIIDNIINLFPTKKIRYQNQFDKVVNLTLPDYVSSTGNTNLAGGGRGSDQNPTGTGGSQGTQIGADGLTASQRKQKMYTEYFNTLLEKYRLDYANYLLMFKDGQETPAKIAIVVRALQALRKQVELALKQMQQFDNYLKSQTGFEALPTRIGAYKVKTIV